MRALHVFLAGLVAVSLVAATTGVSPASTATPEADGPVSVPPAAETAPASVVPGTGDGPTPTPQVSGDEENVSGNVSVNVLSLPRTGPNRTSVDTQYVDLGPALSFAENASAHRLETLTAVENVRAAETEEDRQQRILGELNRIEQRVISLRAEQSRTAERFAAGDISARTALIRFASIDIEARALEARRERLATLAEETPEFGIDPARMNSLSRELDSVTGPVRAHAATVLQGQSAPSRFYVGTASESVVLTTIVGDAYIREAYRGDVRNRTTSRMSPEEAFDIANRSYPTVWELRTDTEILGSGDSYLVRVSYPRGDLSAFIDSGSRTVFKEFQRRPLSNVELGEAATDTRDGLRLNVNRTYPGGPLRVRLTQAETGDPVDANVTIGRDGGESRLVGATGDDGELWTVSPGSRFTVTAIRGNSVVLVTISPSEPPRVTGT
jgi:hypothetical protein